jgi:hypothetical protein
MLDSPDYSLLQLPPQLWFISFGVGNKERYVENFRPFPSLLQWDYLKAKKFLLSKMLLGGNASGGKCHP